MRCGREGGEERWWSLRVKGGGAIEEVTYLSRLSSSQKQSVCVQHIDLVRERELGSFAFRQHDCN